MSGDEYQVMVSDEVGNFLSEADEKTERIVKENLSKLSQPYPGRGGSGDKERITWRGEDVYRLHIGRTWTAFYDMFDDRMVVEVYEILSIDEAHNQYGD